MRRYTIMMTMGPIVNAAARGILPDVPWYVSTAFPMKKLELPKSDGTMKSPSVSENVKIEPATTPGKRQRQDHGAESLGRTGAQIAGGLHQ